MYADSQPGQFLRGAHAVFECAAIGEQGSAGNDSITVSFRDPAVHTGCPPQIIRIHDEVAHLLPYLLFRLALPDLAFATPRDYSCPSVQLLNSQRGPYVPLTAFPSNSSIAVR